MPMKLLPRSRKSLVSKPRFVRDCHSKPNRPSVDSNSLSFVFQAYKCDVSDADLVTKTFKIIDEELGPVTGLIAVSGVALSRSFIHTNSNTLSLETIPLANHLAVPSSIMIGTECRCLRRKTCD